MIVRYEMSWKIQAWRTPVVEGAASPQAAVGTLASGRNWAPSSSTRSSARIARARTGLPKKILLLKEMITGHDVFQPNVLKYGCANGNFSMGSNLKMMRGFVCEIIRAYKPH